MKALTCGAGAVTVVRRTCEKSRSVTWVIACEVAHGGECCTGLYHVMGGAGRICTDARTHPARVTREWNHP
ncbi:hypothetical protein GCM10010508_44060 [Streptomyces naganishii JCM 4654]|uniref:Uncharacterized protein n=1 Tax=Streptomyces naganishii JCM 4654 TaxID=1306179 RepID=A0A918Y764_9ACTN|nr:hypothetical protein GCM10010508_44060 [Streptomyces naganishii JCM 4654]